MWIEGRWVVTSICVPEGLREEGRARRRGEGESIQNSESCVTDCGRSSSPNSLRLPHFLEKRGSHDC